MPFIAWLLGVAFGIALCLLANNAHAGDWGIGESYEGQTTTYHSSVPGVGVVTVAAHLPPKTQPILKMIPPPIVPVLPATPMPAVTSFPAMSTRLDDDPNDDDLDLKQIAQICAMSLNNQACGGTSGSVIMMEQVEDGGHPFE